jgi:hypothetical protein
VVEHGFKITPKHSLCISVFPEEAFTFTTPKRHQQEQRTIRETSQTVIF